MYTKTTKIQIKHTRTKHRSFFEPKFCFRHQSNNGLELDELGMLSDEDLTRFLRMDLAPPEFLVEVDLWRCKLIRPWSLETGNWSSGESLNLDPSGKLVSLDVTIPGIAFFGVAFSRRLKASKLKNYNKLPQQAKLSANSATTSTVKNQRRSVPDPLGCRGSSRWRSWKNHEKTSHWINKATDEKGPDWMKYHVLISHECKQTAKYEQMLVVVQGSNMRYLSIFFLN